MRKTVISHDAKTGIAEIRFKHKGVTVQDTYNLLFVDPALQNNLKEMKLEFTEEMQLVAIKKLQDNIKNGIEAGIIK